MSGRKISELPDAPYKEYAREAERRGVLVTQGIIKETNSIFIIGTLDLIRELNDRITALEDALKRKP